jgi:hypothetical protein
MARWTAKEMTISTENSNEAILYLEALQKQIKTVDIIADYYPGKISIRFEGTKDHLQEALEKAKDLHTIIKRMIYPDREGFYEYNLNYLMKVTGKTIPVKALMWALHYLKYPSQRSDHHIASEIEEKELKTLISSLDKKLEEMPYNVSTTSLRNVLAVIATVKKLTIEETITLAKDATIIKEDELQRLSLAIEPKQALEKVMN